MKKTKEDLLKLNLQQLAVERETLVKATNELFAKEDGGTPLTAEEMVSIKEMQDARVLVEGVLSEKKEMAEIRKANAKAAAELTDVDTSARPGAEPTSGGGGAVGTKKVVIPAKARSYPKKAFGVIYPTNREKAEEQAFKFGQFCIATLGQKLNPALAVKAGKWCEEHGITIQLAASETSNDAGGFLVPEELDSDLIQLREIYGVYRTLAKRVVMRSDSKRRPRRTGGLTAYHLSDNDAITASTKGWDSVNLTAEKIAVLTLVSSEISEDAIIDLADDLAYEIAWAFALQEDNDGFLGDGTSTYGGFIGICPALLNVASNKGITVASGTGYATSWDSIVLKDLQKVKGTLPRYARLANPKWVCSQVFFDEVMERIMTAAGGVRPIDIATGAPQMRFLGYPVEIAQAMPQSSAINQVPVIFGAIQLGADFGDRRETTIAVSTDFAFSQDQYAIRGTERYSINAHDVGSATTPGPIVALETAAS